MERARKELEGHDEALAKRSVRGISLLPSTAARPPVRSVVCLYVYVVPVCSPGPASKVETSERAISFRPPVADRSRRKRSLLASEPRNHSDFRQTDFTVCTRAVFRRRELDPRAMSSALN